MLIMLMIHRIHVVTSIDLTAFVSFPLRDNWSSLFFDGCKFYYSSFITNAINIYNVKQNIER